MDREKLFEAGTGVRFWRDWTKFQATRWHTAEHSLEHPGLTFFEAHLFVVALHNLRRAVDHALKLTSSRAIEGALATFDAQIDRVGDIRNVLEHFDEYLRSEGRLQRSGQIAPTFGVTFGSSSAETVFIEVGPGYRFNTGEAVPAAERLATVVLRELQNLMAG